MSTLRTTTAGDPFSPIAAKVRPIWRNIAIASSFSASADMGSARKTESIAKTGNVLLFFGMATGQSILNLPLIVNKLNGQLDNIRSGSPFVRRPWYFTKKKKESRDFATAFVGTTLQFPDQSNDDSLNSTVVRVDGPIVVVGRLQAGPISLPVESFERCILLIYDCDDQLPVARNTLPTANHVITLVDIGPDHAVASHFERKNVVAGSKTGIQRQGLGVLDGLDRHACRHRAGQWDSCGFRGVGLMICFGQVIKQSSRF
jgi:hypothetical protein